jgi:hypothetical protein
MLNRICDHYFDLTGQASASVIISGSQLTLTNKLIRIKSLSIAGLTTVKKVTFEGNELALLFRQQGHGEFSDLIAPYMSKLALSLPNSPIFRNFDGFMCSIKGVRKRIWNYA